ncbi:unnamed protein product [Ixodes persulcatus]
MAQPTSTEGMSGHTPSTSVNESGTKERRFTINDALNAMNADDPHLFSQYELVEELGFRHLPCSVPKKQLIRRLLGDNANRRGAEGTVETLTSVLETRDEQQTRIEELSTANDKLQADVERLQARMQRLIQAVSLTQASDVPDDAAAAPSNGPTVQRLEPSNIQARPTPTQSNVIIPEVPPRTSTPHENERNEITHLLGMIVETQARISESMARQGQPLQVHSTSDTSTAIPIYDGAIETNIKHWIAEVERIAALAHWTPQLALVNAISRLRGSAKDWQSSYGSKINDWDTWKNEITERFTRKMTMQEFLEFQEKRQLVESYSIVQYIYSKNAKLDMATYTLAMEKRIYLILNGIKDDKWANPFAALCCKTVID